MEFNEKLQELRRQRGLTQEELAEILFVSRTAVSKWESGRGFPSIESLKAISRFFSVSIDDLLSGNELLTIAEVERQRREGHLRDMIFGCLDCSMALLLFLPFFGEASDGGVRAVSLTELSALSAWLKITFLVFVALITVFGLLTLALQQAEHPLWKKCKAPLSVALSALGTGLFIISSQPYVAIFTFFFLIIKALMMIKKR